MPRVSKGLKRERNPLERVSKGLKTEKNPLPRVSKGLKSEKNPLPTISKALAGKKKAFKTFLINQNPIFMATYKPHCSLNYHQISSSELDTFAHAVADGIYNNATTFTAPPLTQPAFSALLSAYHSAYEEYKNGGKNQKGAFLIAKNNLMAGLDTTADYVDGLPDLTEAIIILAGYTPTKVSDSKAVVPAAPAVKSIEQGASGTLQVEAEAVSGADYYGCLITEFPLEPNKGVIFFEGNIIVEQLNLRLELNKSRKKKIMNLRPKTEYWFYFYAGNSAGVSPLGPPSSRVCL